MRGSQFQIPQKDQTSANHRQKPTPDAKKNIRKVGKKSLNPEFTSVLEENRADLESSEDCLLIYGGNPLCESTESIASSTCPPDTPATETVAVSDLTSPSSTITFDENVAIDVSNNKYEISGFDSFKMIDSVEAEMVINSLREARIQVLESKGLGNSKKLLDTLVNVVMEELCDGKYEAKGWLSKFLSSNTNLVIPAFMVWGLAILVWFVTLGSNSICGPPPT